MEIPRQNHGKILVLLCEKHGITAKELRKLPRTRTFSAIRRDIADTLSEETDLSLNEIAYLVGRKYYRRRKPPVTDK